MISVVSPIDEPVSIAESATNAVKLSGSPDEVSRFVCDMKHELHRPRAHIEIALSALAPEKFSDDPSAANFVGPEAKATIARTVERIKRSLQNLGMYSKLYANKLRDGEAHKVEEIPVLEFLTKLEDRWRKTLDSPSIGLSFKISGIDSNSIIKSDESLITQLIDNLIQNACDHATGDKSIRVTFQGSKAPDSNVTSLYYTVSNPGKIDVNGATKPGVAWEYISEPGFTTADDEDRGRGLYICRSIANQIAQQLIGLKDTGLTSGEVCFHGTLPSL